MARKTDIRLRRSNVLNSVPGSANLSDGELAMNTNTGALYFKKSDNTIITAVDNTIFHIDSDTSNSGANKKIGIGTTSPEGLMHFASSSEYAIVFDHVGEEKFKLRHGTSGLYLTGPDTNTLAFGVNHNHDTQMFSTSGSAYATFDGSTSRVGIGTSSPSSLLHISGDSTPTITVTDTTNNVSGSFYSSNFDSFLESTGRLIFRTNGSNNALTISTAQNVGIGTTSPSFKLHVDSGTTDIAAQFKSSDNKAAILISDDDSNTYVSAEGSTSSIGVNAGRHANNLNILSTGAVGIGTTTPEEDLHVVGDIKLTGTLFNGTRDEYSNSNLIRLNQRYTGGAVSGTSYFEQNEYQKVVTVTPNGSSENYQVSGTYYVQSGPEIQTVNFVASLRSNTLPDLSWEIFYDQEDTGVRYIEPFLWTKETTTAGFILGFKVLTGSIFGSVTADVNIIPRNADDKDNVSINTTVQSEQTTIDTGFTNRSFSLRKSVINANTGLGANPGSYRLDVAGNTRTSGSLSLVGTLQSYSGAFNVKNIAQDQDLNLQVNDGGTNTTGLKVQGSTARVGIGASSPDSKLHIQSPNATGAVLNLETTHSGGIPIYNMKGAHSAQLRYQDENGNNQSRIDFLDGGDFNFIDATDGTSHMKISSDGYVGIGDTTPSAKLHVSGDGRIAIFGDNSFDDKYIEFREGGTTGFRLGLRTNYVDTSGDILLTCGDDKGFGIVTNTTAEFSSVATSAADFYITEGGNVGIGTTSPSTTLEVAGDVTLPSNGQIKFRGTNHYPRIYASSNDLKINLDNGSGSNYEAFRIENTTGAITFNNAFTFPTSIGSAGQILKVPSSGSTLVWADDAGGGSATVVTDTDGDTKIQVEESADEDIIRFDVAGSEVAFINSTTFDIAGRLDAARDIRLRGSDSTTNAGVVRLFTDSSNTLKIDTGNDGSNQLSMDSSGNIDVNGTITAVAGDAGNSAYSITSDGGDLVLKAGADDVVLRTGGSGTEAIYFQDGAQNTKMFINAENNRVGINTTSPTYSLHVNGDSNILLKLESTGTDQNARMIFSPSDGDKDWNIGANDNGDFTWYDAQNSRTPIAIALGAAQNSFTIDSSGNVGMSQNLTVTGNLTVNGTTTTINTTTLDVEDKNITLNYSSGDSSGSADGAGITIQDAVDGSTDATFNWNSTNDRWEISHSLNFQDGDPILWGGNSIVQHTGTYTYIGDNSASNSLRLTGGNLGIGRNPSYKLDVSGSINAAYSATNANVIGMHNGSSGEGWIKPFSNGGDFEFNVKYPGGTSDYIFYVNDSTELLRITESGNVGINEDNPLQALHVSGKQRIQSKATHSSSPALHITDNADDVGDQNYTSIHLDYNISGSDTLATTDRNHRGMLLDIDSSASGGDTSNEHRIYGIDVDLDFNGDSDQVIGAQFHTENNNADSIQTQIFGLRSYAVNDTSGTARGTNTYGAWIQAQANHTTTNTNDANLYAVRARTLVSTSADGGRLNDLYGVYSEVEIDDPGQALDVDNVYVGRFTYHNDDGTNNNVSIDNAYLVYGNYQGGAASTGNSYGIYMSSTVPKHYFGSNVGIGTTSPSSLLHLESASSPALQIKDTTQNVTFKAYAQDSNTHLANTSNHDLIIDTNNTERMRIKSSGNVGIGTNSPSRQLTVQNSSNAIMALVGGTTGLAYYTLGDTDDDNYAQIILDNSTNKLQIQNGGGTGIANRGITLDSSENVGIGTSSPSHPLHLSFSGDNGAEIQSTDSHSSLYINSHSGYSQYIRFEEAGASKYWIQSTSGKLVHRPAGTTDTSKQVTFDANGKVGIGTTSMSYPLEVHGNTASSHRVRVINAANGQSSVDLKTSQQETRLITSSGNAFYVYNQSNSSQPFTILSNGNVGINDSSPSAKLHVVGSVLNNSLQDYGIAAFENTNLEGLSIGYDADGNFTYLYSREVGVGSRGLHLNGSIFVDNYGGTVGIGTVTPNSTCSLELYKNGADSVLRIHDDAGTHAARLHLRSGGNDARIQLPNTSNGLEFRTEQNLVSGSAALTLQTNGKAEFGYAVKIEEYQIDTTETSTSATTETVIHSFAAATFRSARYTVQVTNSTDSAYHTTELLLVHDGTTANITEFGTIFTGTAAEATFDADINSGNVRLKATPASGDSMEFKVIAHSVTV